MRKLLAVLFSLLLPAALVACGDDDDGGGSGSASATGSASGTEDDASGSGTDDEGDDTDSTETTADGDDSGDDTDTTESAGDDPVVSGDFCEQAQVFATDTSLGELDFTDPEDIATGVGLLEDFRDAAPEEIQDDLQVIIDGFQTVATAMAEAGDDPAAQQAVAEDLADELAALSEASTTVQQFTQQECGIDITGGGGTTPAG